MTRELISLQVGQAGNQIGEAFWRMILAEHGLDEAGYYHGTNQQQLDRVGTYFSEVEARGGNPQKYVPRSLQIDLEAGVCNRIRSSSLGKLFPPDSWIHSESGAANNWGRGYYTEGAEILDAIMEAIRHECEKCDALQGFQILHSIGGGTGSGLGTLLLSKLREEEPDRMLATFSILPSPKVSETVVEPYNALLSLHQLTETSDLSICLDNEALYDIAVRTLRNPAPTFDHLNTLVSQVLCGVSTSLRFPGQLNGDLRKLAINLIPFPRLHFLLPSYAPLSAATNRAFEAVSVPELVSSLFDRKNLLVACDPRFGRYLTAATIFRGKVASKEAEHAIQALQNSNSSYFVEWIPDNVSITLCDVPPAGQKYSGTCLANSTVIQETFKRTHNQFYAMFKRRAFLHRYTEEGMDEMEFAEAESNINDLIQEYLQYQESSAGGEDNIASYLDENPSEY